jgi:hypothetical protein
LLLAVARRRVNERLIGEDLDVKLVLDRAARLGRRKNQAESAPSALGRPLLTRAGV